MQTRSESSTITVYAAPHTYCSHACVTKLADGDWLVIFSQSTLRDPILHPPGDPHFVNMLCRSHDQGRTWTQPRIVPNYEWHGVETPGITQISNGDVLVNQWRFLWYPLELAKRLWSNGELACFVYTPKARHWHPVHSEEDWAAHPYPYARTDGAAYVHISTDNGYTWDHTVPVDIAPYQGAFSPKGAIELQNGDLLLALGSHDHDPLAASMVVRSTDKGRSWQKPVEAARIPGLIFSEPTVAETINGKLLLMSREESTGYVYQSVSSDGGDTWAPARPLPHWGYPIHCIRLADHRMLIIYGRRKEPFGIRAALSEDEGEHWSEEIIIRDDLPNRNLGYPSVIEYAPGKLFTAYYGENADGLTSILGTYFSV